MKPSLREYVEATQHFKLRPSQIELCNQLERAFWAKVGERAEIPVDVQAGTSVIASQCYPAWVLGHDPLHRFRLATYGLHHSMRFSRSIRRLLKSEVHRQMFPDPAGQVDDPARLEAWSTRARVGLGDGQPSFIALGLLSESMCGTAVDTLIVDDMFQSKRAEDSELIRDIVRRFWTESARPRLGEQSNVFAFPVRRSFSMII